MRVRGRAGNLREPSIQRREQKFETAHRMKFREDRATLLERPRFDLRELACFEPCTELA
jgi:hypothetical protein